MILTTVMNKKHFVVLAFLAAALPMAAQQSKRAFAIEDFYRVRTASELDVSRDGSRFVFTVTTSNLPQAKRSTNLWIGWQKLGLEWAWRLAQDPGRLWRRYFSTNGYFLSLLLREASRRLFRPAPRGSSSAGS